MTYAFCTLLMLLLAKAAWSDIKHRRISNRDVGAIGALWLLSLPFVATGALLATVSLALLVLVAGIVVWWAGWLGAGDAKLIAVLSLWAGPELITPLLLGIVICGGVIAAVMLVIRQIDLLAPAILAQVCSSSNHRPAAALAAFGAVGTASVPYGVAIAAGGFWTAYRLIAA